MRLRPAIHQDRPVETAVPRRDRGGEAVPGEDEVQKVARRAAIPGEESDQPVFQRQRVAGGEARGAEPSRRLLRPRGRSKEKREDRKGQQAAHGCAMMGRVE